MAQPPTRPIFKGWRFPTHGVTADLRTWPCATIVHTLQLDLPESKLLENCSQLKKSTLIITYIDLTRFGISLIPYQSCIVSIALHLDDFGGKSG